MRSARREARPGPRLLYFKHPNRPEQQQVAGQFTERITDIENFVILVQAKDGSLQIMPCIDPGISVLEFVSAFQTRLADHILEQLTHRPGKPRLAG